jgi:proteasome accessory factor A
MALFGVETEYAICSLGRGPGLDQQAIVTRLIELARKRFATLADAGSGGLFLGNGARFYVDTGMHPEFATPEVANPVDLVRYILAGERLLGRLITELYRGARGESQVACFRSNVDYGGTGSTWGCHESYLHRADSSAMPEQMIPHLVTRIIYTGAGGFDSTFPGVRFLLSPRVPHLVNAVSGNSTGERGIFHSKNEPLSGNGFHRMHVLSGESLSSERATWLKAATTALIVALIDAGVEPGTAVKLQAPVEAMRTIAADIECKASVAMANGPRSSAVAIQRHYLELAEKHIGKLATEPWAPDVCREWRRTLDSLETGPESLATTLDWVLKRKIFERRLHKHGMTWESVARWNPFVERLSAAFRQSPAANQPFTPDLLLASESPVRSLVEALSPLLASRGLDWRGLKSFLALRAELCEIDMRFGQLLDQSIFSSLDRTGLLTHHVPGVDRIEDAVISPPPYGRARLRGEVIARLAGAGRRHFCDWEGVWDRANARFLDLSDPFSTEERWRATEENEESLATMSFFRRNFLSVPLRRIRSRRSSPPAEESEAPF